VGQFDRAIGSELKCLRRAPKNFWARVILGWAYEQKRMFPEALAELREAVKLTDGAAFTVAAGDRRGALDVLAQLKQKSQKGYVSGFDVALIYAALGENDRAFRYLDQAERDHASMLPYITWDRRADSLRADPRYRIVLQKLALPAATLPPSTRAALAQKPAVGQ